MRVQGGTEVEVLAPGPDLEGHPSGFVGAEQELPFLHDPSLEPQGCPVEIDEVDGGNVQRARQRLSQRHLLEQAQGAFHPDPDIRVAARAVPTRGARPEQVREGDTRSGEHSVHG